LILTSCLSRQANFPRTPRVRPKFVIKTLALVAGILAMIVTGLTHFILPILRKVVDRPAPHSLVSNVLHRTDLLVPRTQSNELPFLYLLSILCIPCSLLYIVMYAPSLSFSLSLSRARAQPRHPTDELVRSFFFVFELILNGFAEVTRFADRHFYDDWWYVTCTTSPHHPFATCCRSLQRCHERAHDTFRVTRHQELDRLRRVCTEVEPAHSRMVSNSVVCTA
jgi:hypothetical protein